MSLLLPTLAVAFAAFCVWLTVRIINRRERWAKWTLGVVVGLPVLYVASFGPACWMVCRNPVSRSLPNAYWLIGWCGANSSVVQDMISVYARIGMPAGSKVWIPGRYPVAFQINN